MNRKQIEINIIISGNFGVKKQGKARAAMHTGKLDIDEWKFIHFYPYPHPICSF
jgi:hypothetical protein